MKYTNKNRGIIQNKKHSTQVNDFRNLRFNNITPTDIDGFIDYKNKKFILIEMKFKGAALPYDQKLALERLCDSCNKDTVLIIADHNSQGDIDVGNCFVREYRYRRKWVVQFEKITVSEAVNRFINKQ